MATASERSGTEEPIAGDEPSAIRSTGGAFLLAAAVFAVLGVATLAWVSVQVLWFQVFDARSLARLLPAPLILPAALAALLGLVVGLRGSGGAWPAVGVGLGVGVGDGGLAALNVLWQVVGTSGVLEPTGIFVSPSGGLYAGRALTSVGVARAALRDLLVEPAGSAVLAAVVAVAAGYGRRWDGVPDDDGSPGDDGVGAAGSDGRLRTGVLVAGSSALAYVGLQAAVGVPVYALGALSGGAAISGPAGVLGVVRVASPFVLAAVLGLSAGVRAGDDGLAAGVGVGLGLGFVVGALGLLDLLVGLLGGVGLPLVDLVVLVVVHPGLVGATATVVALAGWYYGR